MGRQRRAIPDTPLPTHQVWAEMANQSNSLFLDMINTSRTYFQASVSSAWGNAETGLFPDMSTFAGEPCGGRGLGGGA